MTSKTRDKYAPDSNDIRRAFSFLDVSNVFVYVGDAVRDDLHPTEFKQNGMYIRTIASSIHSPASFASIVTGNYPSTHGVTSFNDRLSPDIHRIFDIPGVETRFLNSIFAYAEENHGQDIDPIYSVLNTDPSPVESPFKGLETPFIAMERGPGGHAPYGDFTGTAVQYFKQRGSDRQAILDDYERSIELDIEWFNQRVQELDERDLLEDTLVIYTSDHGELLGEGGLLGHNDPMRPELVYVPTIIHHPELPNEQLRDTTFHHVDLLPTILTALGGRFDDFECDGVALPKALNAGPRPCFWENQFLPDWVIGVSGELSYEGVWDDLGGRVKTETNRQDRYSVLAGKLFRSSKRKYMWHHLGKCIASYWWSSREFGSPSFDKTTESEVTKRAKEGSVERHQTELSSEEKEHLKDLGYLN